MDNSTCLKCGGTGEIICSVCNGTGRDETCQRCDGDKIIQSENGDTSIICPDCEGTGKQVCKNCFGEAMVECPDCEGTGERHDQ